MPPWNKTFATVGHVIYPPLNVILGTLWILEMERAGKKLVELPSLRSVALKYQNWWQFKSQKYWEDSYGKKLLVVFKIHFHFTGLQAENITITNRSFSQFKAMEVGVGGGYNWNSCSVARLTVQVCGGSWLFTGLEYTKNTLLHGIDVTLVRMKYGGKSPSRPYKKKNIVGRRGEG